MQSVFSRLYGRVTDLSDSMVDFALRLDDIGADAQERFMHHQYDAAEAYLDWGLKQGLALVECATPGDWLPTQLAIGAELLEHLTLSVQEMFDLQVESQDALLQCLADGAPLLCPGSMQ